MDGQDGDAGALDKLGVGLVVPEVHGPVPLGLGAPRRLHARHAIERDGVGVACWVVGFAGEGGDITAAVTLAWSGHDYKKNQIKSNDS